MDEKRRLLRRKLLAMTVGVLLVGAGVEIWQMRGRLEEVINRNNETLTEEEKIAVIEESKDLVVESPIQKFINADEKVVTYQVRGMMVDDLDPTNQKFMVGRIMLDDGVGETPLHFMAGGGGGNVSFGQGEKTEDGYRFVWNWKDQSEVRWLFVKDVPIVLRFQYDYSENPSVAGSVQIWDRAMEAFEKGEEMVFPEEYGVYAYGIGIIEN